ncbi:response regulator [Ensifer soli]|uniref:response regulator n=1 Tax=Ciceribacter sp. sgz301302 TaxID=3342379 RepID=UPI0035BAA2FB
MMKAVEIAVVDDEPALRNMIADYLDLNGFAVATAENGAALDRLLAARRPEIILLDVNMPGEDGLSIVKRLRDGALRAGILMLTANADEASKVRGLVNGADDYITKPFDLRELLARVRSVLRRMPPPPDVPASAARPNFGPFRLDADGRRLFDPGGIEIEISTMEYEVLDTFLRHPRIVLSRERLAELAHGKPLGPGDRSIDIRIARLRKKLDVGDGAGVLRTVRGEGYVFEP